MHASGRLRLGYGVDLPEMRHLTPHLVHRPPLASGPMAQPTANAPSDGTSRALKPAGAPVVCIECTPNPRMCI